MYSCLSDESFGLKLIVINKSIKRLGFIQTHQIYIYLFEVSEKEYPYIWDGSSSHLSASFTLFSWAHLKFQTVLFWPLSTLFVSPRPQENHSMAWILPDTREEKTNPDYWHRMKSIRPIENSQAIKSIHFMTWYDSLSDVPESRVCFASKKLTPCRMHWNAFLIAQIIAKCHSFPNMYDML